MSDRTGVSRRRYLIGGAVGGSAVLGWMAGCAWPSPTVRTVRVSEARVAERLALQFPYTYRHLDLLEWRLSNPWLRLIPLENRLATRLDVAVGLLEGRQRQRQGTVTLSCGLHLDMDDRSLRLRDIRLDALEVPGLSGLAASLTQRLTGALLQERFRELVVHRLSDDDVRIARGWGYEPGDLRVVPGGLELELRPIRRS